MKDKPERGTGWQRLFAVVLLAGLALAPAAGVQAAGILVTTTADELNTNGQCSLREALANANANNQSGSTDCAAGAGADTITFGVSGTIGLASELTISDAAGLTIRGSAGGISLSGNNATRVLTVESSAQLVNLTVANGRADNGGGIYNYGTLSLNDCILSGNVSTGGFASSGGGGIAGSGSLTVLDSTFSYNSATVGGGAIRSTGTLMVVNSFFNGNSASDGGGIVNYGASAVATVLNSTFFANSASGAGGGIYNQSGSLAVTNSSFYANSATSGGGGAFNTGTLTVTNSTFSGNTSSQGSGFRNSDGTTTLRNSIVADSPAEGNCVGAITNGGNNIENGSSCGWGSNLGSLSNTDPRLAPFAYNGGPTNTFALRADSPAIDAVTYNAPNGCPLTDQRGYLRPVDGDDNGSALFDIGAVEFGAHAGFFIYLPLVVRGP